MIITSLDEYGRFENLTKPSCMLIGGAAFRCETEEEVTKELKRLQRFFHTICDEQECAFPYDLHYNRENGHVVNGNAANKVKEALIAELPMFLNRSGRWHDPNHTQGKYYLYALVGDKKGMNEDATILSNLSDDGKAANRYDHMAYRTVENMLFFNPALDDDKNVRLDFATRVISTVNNPQLKSELTELGYDRRRTSEGFDEDTFISTDATSFRAAIAAAQLYSDNEDIHFDLNVQSINYNHYNLQQGFLYLADTICSAYDNQLKGINNVSDAVRKLYDYGSNTLTRERILLWAYAPIDKTYRKAWNSYKNGDLYHLAEIICENHFKDDNLSAVYDKIWMERLEKRFLASNNSTGFVTAMDHFDYCMLTKQVTLSAADRILSLMKKKREATPSVGNAYLDDRLEYLLGKLEMSLSNHFGDYNRALAAYQKLKEFSGNIPIEEFLGLQLLFCVTCSDAGEFEKEENVARTVVSHYEMLCEIKRDIFADCSSFYDSYGRALSQLGQCFCYQGEFAKGIEQFDLALERFQNKEGSDVLRTRNYKLQALIEDHNEELFRSEAKLYFGTDDPIQMTEALFRGKKFRYNGHLDQYAIYVLTKALWAFWRDTFTIKRLQTYIEKIVAETEKTGGEHPRILILKYCSLLWRYRLSEKDPPKADLLFQDALSAVRTQSGILPRIRESTANHYHMTKDNPEAQPNDGLLFMYR